MVREKKPLLRSGLLTTAEMLYQVSPSYETDKRPNASFPPQLRPNPLSSLLLGAEEATVEHCYRSGSMSRNRNRIYTLDRWSPWSTTGRGISSGMGVNTGKPPLLGVPPRVRKRRYSLFGWVLSDWCFPLSRKGSGSQHTTHKAGSG